MNNEQCTHYWLIDGSNVGCCIRCGDVRDFGALMKREVADILESAWERGGKRGRPRKESDGNSSYSG